MRPIGIGETPRRIIAKALLAVTRSDILETVGSTQPCAGQIAGAESVVHAVRGWKELKLYSWSMLAMLLIHLTAKLPYKTSNLSIQPSPPLSSTHIYRELSELFTDGEVIYSQEGTTQGHPLAMPMYVAATLPMIKKLPKSTIQVWYADDASPLGTITNLWEWWDELASLGPCYGYYPTPSNILQNNDAFAERARTKSMEKKFCDQAGIQTQDQNTSQHSYH